MVRISGGTAKGRKVGGKKAFSRTPGGDDLRPTPAKVREALFNILRDEVTGASFLDLYAGTGAVGIEALSRGAARAVFVDENPLRIKIIGHILGEFGFAGRAETEKTGAIDFLRRRSGAGEEPFDIIFLDPPYSSGDIPVVLSLVGEGTVLRGGGILVAEHFSRTALPDAAGSLKMQKTYRYGDTSLTLYRKEGA